MAGERFGESTPFSVGVEEELMILDEKTLEPVPAVHDLLAAAAELDHPGVLKTELHASVVELNSGVCDSAAEALDRLVRLRTAAADAAAQIGAIVAASGSHPLADPLELTVIEKPRYQGFLEYAGPSARRQGVNGLHVHVGVADGDECFKALEGVLPWLPVVLGLSANSPYIAGRETGLMSNRAEVLAQLPRSGAPPAFRSYAEWKDFVERFRASGVPLGSDYTSFWWDVRPHPRFGTLEIRMADQPTGVGVTAVLTALVQALCKAVVDAPPREHAPWERGVYQQNRWAAARFGTEAVLMHPDEPRAEPASRIAGDLLELVGPAARELGSEELLSGVELTTCEAERQLEIGRLEGLDAVCRDLVERSLQFG